MTPQTEAMSSPLPLVAADSALPEGVRLLTAELLAGPLDPAAEQVLAAGSNPQAYLRAPAWL